MPDHLIDDELAGLVANDLMHLDGNPAVIFCRERLRLNDWVESLQLMIPVSADRIVSMEARAFQRVRPIDVAMHQVQHGFEVTPIEGLVEVAEGCDFVGNFFDHMS